MRGLFDGGRPFLNMNTGGGLIITDTLTFTRFQLQYFRSWNHHDLNISLKNDDMSAGGAAAAEAAGEDSLDAHAAQALPSASAPPSPPPPPPPSPSPLCPGAGKLRSTAAASRNSLISLASLCCSPPSSQRADEAAWVARPVSRLNPSTA